MLLKLFSSRKRRAERQSLFRNFLFGVEDSLVSTVGLLSGVAAAGTQKSVIVTTGIVLIFVEAFSMGIGSFLSEETSREIIKTRFSRVLVIKSALVMFVSYFVAGFIPLFPHILFSGDQAWLYSIALTLFALTVLGGVMAKLFQGKIVWKAVEMLLLGGLATGIGIAIGRLLG